jgi:hypothetical protein
VDTVDISGQCRNIQSFPIVGFGVAYNVGVLGMSVLDDFVRMQLYRKQAAEFQVLADNASLSSVRRRYRIIARHYGELADREDRLDKARMAERLKQIKRKRQEATEQITMSAANDGVFFLLATE